MGLYRTIMTERERMGLEREMAANDLTLITMLVRYDHDVATARSYWPRFKAAAASPPRIQTLGATISPHESFSTGC